jgi:ribosomal protein S18 acetylase RimI-like enzyme
VPRVPIRLGLDYNSRMPRDSKIKISLRPATPADAEAAAALMYETMPTLGEYLFGQPDAAGTIRVLAGIFPAPGHLLSYQYSTLATFGMEAVGIAQVLPSNDMARAAIGLARALRRRFGWAAMLRLIYRGIRLANEPDTEPGEYYVNTLAVAPAWRNQGIGARLLEEAERRGRELGLSVLSLGVLLHNTNAKRFYERVGFREALKYETRPLAPGVKYTGFYRMVKPIDRTDRKSK